MLFLRIVTALVGVGVMAIGISALSKLTRPALDAGRGQIAVIGVLAVAVGALLLVWSWRVGRPRGDRGALPTREAQ